MDHEIDIESLTLVRRAAVALAVGMLSCATGLAQQVSISDVEALRQFVPEFTDSEIGFPLTETQQRLVASRGPGVGGYRLTMDLNADGRPELVLFGHGTKSGMSQSFVVILTQNVDGTWARAKLLTFSRPYLVGQISPNGNGINVFFCEACDSGGRVTWNGSDYQFDPFSPGPPPTSPATPSN